jgi:hypothetical protein
VLVPWLGSSSTSALDHKFGVIDCTDRISSFFPNLLFKPNIPEMVHFLPKTYKTKRTQKESKIAQTNKTKRLININ